MTGNSNNSTWEFEKKVGELWWVEKINKENTTEALTSVIKHIIDKVLLQEQTLSKHDQNKLKKLLWLLNDIKDITTEYSTFFDENSLEIDKIISNREDISVLSKQLTYNYDLISWLYDYLDKNFIDLIDSLKSTKSFFKLSNFWEDWDNKFDLLLDALDKTTTPEEKLSTLESDLRDLEWIVQTLSRDIYSYSKIMETFIGKIKVVSKSINDSYIWTIDSFFGEYSTWNVSFEYKDSEILPFFLDNLIDKIPNKLTYANSFKKDLLTLFNSEKFDLIMWDEFVKPEQIQLFKDLHSFYKKVSKKYKKVSDTIDKIYEKTEQKRFEFDKVEDDNKWYKILDIFKDWENRFLEDIDKVARKDRKIYKIDKDKDTVWTEKSQKIKKKLFDEIMKIHSLVNNLNKTSTFKLEDYIDKIDSISLDKLKAQEITIQLQSEKLKQKKRAKLEEELAKIKEEENIDTVFISWENLWIDYVLSEEFNKIILNIIWYKKEFDDLLDKERGKTRERLSEDKEAKFTHHYKIESEWQHWGISWFKKHNVNKPAKVVGKTAREVIDKIKQIAKNSKKLRTINQAFPWYENTLEGNLIVLWPWGGGKTALLNELSYEKGIITIEANKSDIISVWYWETEKNIDKLWQKAVELHKETWKEVFIFLDEFDNYFKWTWLSCWGWPDIQKEFQTRLDWLEAFEWVHIVWLSNVPHKIPIDIYRRMEKTYVLEELELSDKVELFYSRLDNFPLSEDLNKFMTSLTSLVPEDKNTVEKLKSSYITVDLISELIENWDLDAVAKVKHDDLDVIIKYFATKLWFNEEESKIFEKLFQTTPKILYQATERVYKNYINWLDKKQIKDLTKSLKEINKQKVIKKEDMSKAFLDVIGKSITMQDFRLALEEVFSNASTKAEIKWNSKFFTLADKMLNAISSNAFDWFDDDENDNWWQSVIIKIPKNWWCSDWSCST